MNSLIKFIEIYNPKNLESPLREINTVALSIKTPTASVVDLIKAHGPVKTIAYLKLWLTDLNEFLHLKNPLTETEITFIAEAITEDFRTTTIADINIIFRRAKKGIYGKFYERLSAPEILTWFRDYYEERSNLAGELHRMSHSNQKGKNVFSETRTRQSKRLDEIGFDEFKQQLNLENFQKK